MSWLNKYQNYRILRGGHWELIRLITFVEPNALYNSKHRVTISWQKVPSGRVGKPHGNFAIITCEDYA